MSSDDRLRRPPRPDGPEPRPTGGRIFALIFVLSLGVLLLAGLVVLSLFWVGAVIVIGSGIAVLLLQYFIWGWWLGPMLRDAEANEPDDE
jgi:hypothetical protein